MKKKELLAKIDDLEQTVRKLRGNVEMQDRLIDQFQTREQQVVDTALSLAERTESIINEAGVKAEQILRDARAQADRLLMNAKTDAARKMADAESTLREYEDMIRQYNYALERAASDATANAKVFAQFAKKQMAQFDMRDFAEDSVRSAPSARENNRRLEDSSDNPGSLMRNIYRIQGRDIPEQFFDMQDGGEPDPIPEEPESEMPAPKVSELVDAEASHEGTETDLDDLIDEILKAGEKNTDE